MDLSSIKALMWDIGGTVFDYDGTIYREVGSLAKERGLEVDAARFANDWRTRIVELLNDVRSGDLPWMHFGELHRRSLDDILVKHSSLQLNDAEKDDLNAVWHRLDTRPDAPKAIEKIRSRYTMSVLTILSFAIAVDCSKANGVVWDAIISCEFLGHYKPDAEVYLKAVRLLGIEPEQAMMVAAHKYDLWAAKEAGLHTALILIPGESGTGNDPDLSPEEGFDINAADYVDLARQLVG